MTLDQREQFSIAVQALHDHAVTVLDACAQHIPQEDLTVVRNVAEILFSLMQELQEREEAF